MIMGSWNHVVLEGGCMYNSEIFEDVPCCNIKPGFASIICLNDNNDDKCPYFGYTGAPSSISYIFCL